MPWRRPAVPGAAGLDGDEVFRRAELVTRDRYPTLAGGPRSQASRLAAARMLLRACAVGVRGRAAAAALARSRRITCQVA